MYFKCEYMYTNIQPHPHRDYYTRSGMANSPQSPSTYLASPEVSEALQTKKLREMSERFHVGHQRLGINVSEHHASLRLLRSAL